MKEPFVLVKFPFGVDGYYVNGGFPINVGSVKGRLVNIQFPIEVVGEGTVVAPFAAMIPQRDFLDPSILKLKIVEIDGSEFSDEVEIAGEGTLVIVPGPENVTDNLPVAPLIPDLEGIYVGDGMFDASWTPVAELPCKFQSFDGEAWNDCDDGATTTDTGELTDIVHGDTPPFPIRIVSADGTQVYSNVYTVPGGV